MRKILLLFAAAFMFAACSAPKYAYHFDHYDYNSGRKQAVAQNASPVINAEASPIVLQDPTMVADAASTPVINATRNISAADKKAVAEKLASMSKTEKKELKTNLKKYIKAVKNSPDHGASVNAAKAWDHDLKMAAIFGIIAVVLTALYGVSPVFWILGVVALVVAVVFLIQWLSRQ
jgi:hypothetical protein